MIIVKILGAYWIPAFIYLIIWSFRLRKSSKELEDIDKLGELLVYVITLFIGVFVVFWLTPRKMFSGQLPH